MCYKQIHTSIDSFKDDMRSILVKSSRSSAYQFCKKHLSELTLDKFIARDAFNEMFVLDKDVELSVIFTDNFDGTVTVNIIAYSENVFAKKKQAIVKLKNHHYGKSIIS